MLKGIITLWKVFVIYKLVNVNIRKIVLDGYQNIRMENEI